MSRRAADSSVFTALADPTRRAILWQLRDGERTVTELMEPLDLSQSAFSQHLGVLRDAGLVASRRDGRYQVYSVNPAALYEVVEWIRHFDAFWQGRFERLGRYLDRKPKGGRPS